MSEAVLNLKNISKSFHQGDSDLKILIDANLSIKKGEIVSIVGPSGCGKSTLLHIAGLLDKADNGNIFILGQDCKKLSDRKKTEIRRNHLGFVYQYHHLLPEFSAAENIVLPQIIKGINKKEAKANALRLLDQFGISRRANHRPAELSGGEQQRVAIARAMANHPALLLADEPTGNLDPHTADDVYSIMMEQIRSRSLSVLIVTHNPELAKKSDRVFTLVDGVLI